LLWDKEKKLIKTLGLKYLPALLMINEEGVIINSFIIMPEIRELNPVFIEAALNWVNE